MATKKYILLLVFIKMGVFCQAADFRMLFLINKTCGNIAQHLKYFVSRKADDNHKHRLDTRKKISVRQGTFKK